MSAASRLTSTVLIHGEAIEQAGAAGAHQVLLAAAAAGMSRIPGRVATASAIEMAKLGCTVAAAAAPIPAGVVHAVIVRGAVGFRAGQDVVRVGLVAEALYG